MTHDFYDTKTISSLLTLCSVDMPTRNNDFKLFKNRVYTKQFQCFFTNRVVNMWNKLPSEIVNADNTNVFKNKIDKFLCDLKYNTYL